ncbi:hypothetical protein ASF63_15635 [Microbacterium sp. Leaf320]|nr:hypothetical protein ASF63_15635 [Microbacterium sp. Leaf320]
MIPGLLRGPSTVDTAAAFTLAADAPLFGDDRTVPVARFEAENFLGEPSTVVQVATDGEWSLVLTPSRQNKPSQVPDGSTAAAQTAAWVPTVLLTPSHELRQHVVISASRQTLEIRDTDGRVIRSFPVAVGAPGTPTPTGAVGYLQARYLDPSQGQTTHRIQLTSLHATAADEPFRGSDGGLIGIHFGAITGGTISHGCIRGDNDTLTTIDSLPVGTLVHLVR